MISYKFKNYQFINTTTKQTNLNNSTQNTIEQQNSSKLSHTLHQQTHIIKTIQSLPSHKLTNILTHLIKTYILNKTTPIHPKTNKILVPHQLHNLNFTKLIKTLKFHINIPKLKQFSIINKIISIQLNNKKYIINKHNIPPQNNSKSKSTTTPTTTPHHTISSTPPNTPFKKKTNNPITNKPSQPSTPKKPTPITTPKTTKTPQINPQFHKLKLN